jgi:uncharacterized membrane-anchored protein
MPFPFMKPGQPAANLLLSRSSAGGMHGVVRVDARTKRLVRRLKAGEFALIDHPDLDGPVAEALVAARARAVLNAAPSISGRYPNRGPEILQAAGILLIDSLGPTLLTQVHEGEVLTVREGMVWRGEECLAQGQVMSPARLTDELTRARANLDGALQDFVRNTLSFVEHESGLLFEAAEIPPFAVEVRDRHVLVVVRGDGTPQDLAAIHGYIRDRRPAIIGVDGGADLLRDRGFTPDIIFGDMDSISDESLRCGAQLIVHAYPDGRCPGKARLDRLGLTYHILPGRGTSEDIILLAAYERGAELIIAVGTHFNLIDFLDKSRGGMSSTFLVRLRVGSRLVDAKGVSRLYYVPYPLMHFSLMILTVLAAAATILWSSREAQSFVQLVLMRVQQMLSF